MPNFKTYAILAEDFDYTNPSTNDFVSHAHAHKQYVPYDIPEVVNHCGSFQALSEKSARHALSMVKEKFPNIRFTLYEGETFGSLQQIVSM